MTLTRILAITFTVLLMVNIAVAGSQAEGQTTKELRFYGRTIFNMHYDTAIQSQEYSSYLTDDTTEEFNFNPRDTRLGVEARETCESWTYRAVFEMGFYGSNAGNNILPRLRLGYAEAIGSSGLSIRGGQDWIPIAQQLPGCIDFGILSWSGNLWWRVPQMTLRYKSGNVEYLASAMKHRISNNQEMQEIMPWMIGRVAVGDLFGEKSLLALGAGYRSVDVDNNEYTPYLAALEFYLPFGDSGVVVNGEAYVGKGIGREFVHYGFDYNPDHPDGAREIESKGGFINLASMISDRIQINLGYGFDDPADCDMDNAATAPPYLKNTVMYGNMKYKVTKQFGWGLEVLNYATDVGGTDDLTGQRFTGSWWYVF